MKQIQESSQVRKKATVQEDMKIWDCGSPLYDSYELVAVSNIIERHFIILPNYLRQSRKVAAFAPAALTSLPVTNPTADLPAIVSGGKEVKERGRQKKIGIGKFFSYVKSTWKK
ncbi:developmentally-regulated GTP-binding protein 1 homolog [Striga asiatica]|uniref:Developmentally-regulated GTP-binding protein 1 homolog n=1 Tax=Striga asiatica TaxID=4170 RepID=A0A5A7P1H2_STRAF|nr:developmentally-regulated GTP-binding protein 1 homolog [Striga asiatica]